ncbi:hypothetical protein LX16_2077 [Stackebrandtia albiflava]|uniref:Uncharacterized protein n=1 Tax=Stackebrandtia albiflava TaxID=406432 RepID=A0A562VER3_9ACTN|nr:hypothetical protein [Stackebrandtia albiflava]TWJ16348.1 hypothetical protein LX16_2077 [Stackebrandtia albiflava]
MAAVALLTAACGRGESDAAPADDGGEFDTRAQQVATAWQAVEPADYWGGDAPVLLDRPVVATPDGEELTEAQSSAVANGWYVLDAALPDSSPPGEIQGITVDTWSAEQAWEALAIGGEPPADCPREPVPDETSGTGDDGTTSHTAVCGVLTVTDVRPGTTTRWTSLGSLEVPAWLYTVDGLSEPISQVAFDTAESPQPAPLDVPDFTPPAGLTGAAGIESVDGAELTYLLAGGACDTDFQPLAYETRDAIVVAGTMKTDDTQMCTEQLTYTPVTVELTEPVGDRMVIDAASATVLRIGGYFPA